MSKSRSYPDWPCPVAFCITDLHVGGAERCLTELVLRLDRDRFLPSVISLAPRPPTEQSELVERLENAGIKPAFMGFRKPWQFPFAVRQLKRQLDALQPALLQTFLFHANCVGATAARQAGIAPVVAGIRVADPRSRFRLRLERHFTRNAACYVCVSQAVATFSARQGGLPADRLIVIPNGVDVADVQLADPADLQQFGVPPSRRGLLYVGRLDAQKRVDRVVSVFAAIAPSLPQHDLLIVGDGLERDRLQRLARDTNFARRIHFAGHSRHVASIMKSCDLLMLTSQWEGMPNVLLEAMAAGIPVATFDVEGAAELLGPVAQRQLVTAEGRESVALQRLGQSVVELASDDELRQRVGRSNQQRVEEFSLDKMAHRYQEVFLQQLQLKRCTNQS